MTSLTYAAIWTEVVSFVKYATDGSPTATIESGLTRTISNTVPTISATATVTFEGQTTTLLTALEGLPVSLLQEAVHPDAHTTTNDDATSFTKLPESSVTATSATTPAAAAGGSEWTGQSTTTVTSTLTISQPTAPSLTESPEASKSSVGISAGVVAGVGIACAAVGAILASLLLFLLVIKRSPRATTRSSSMHGLLAQNKPRSGYARWPALRRKLSPATSTLPILEASLPRPLQDSEIASGLQRFGTCITNHTHSFFHTNDPLGSVDLSQDYLARLLGSEAPISAAEVTSLMASPATRVAAVRFLLAWCILQHVQSGSDPCKSLLPPEIAESMESMAPPPDGTQKDENHVITQSRWRQLTAFLMSPTYNTDTISPSDPHQRNISDLTTALDVVLAPVASRMQGASRRQDLEGLVIRGAHYGWLLFSQPTSWMFDWDVHGSGVESGNGDEEKKDELVVLPALLQIGDDWGRSLQVARVLAEAQTVKLESA